MNKVKLTEAEVTQLRQSYNTWEYAKLESIRAQAVHDVCLNYYQAIAKKIRRKYGLSPQFVVDYSTGEVTDPVEETDG